MFTERRSCVRHKVNGPVFASFDGVTGGMILDLSDQGLSMQTVVPLSRDRHLHLRPTCQTPKPNSRLRATSPGQTLLAALACASLTSPKKHAAVSIAGSPSMIRRPVARLPNSQWMECSGPPPTAPPAATGTRPGR